MYLGLLTIHHAYNYGAMLQSYATYLTLTSLGHDVEFVDYDNNTFYNQRQLFLPNSSIFNVLRNIRNMKNKNYLNARKRAFEEFYQNFRVSKKKYKENSIFDLSQYDAVVVGSDQTFSLYLTNHVSEMKPFFLSDAICKKKISLASSMGEKNELLTQEDKVWMAAAFKGFDMLSVREDNSACYIKDLIGVTPSVILDPTLWITKKEWEKKINQFHNMRGNYILFYTVLSEAWVIPYVKRFAKKTGLKVIALHPQTRFDIGSGFEYINDIGPLEFVAMIKNAQYIVTTSFHATAFSIIFNKNFISLRIGQGNRIISLLKTCKLDNMVIDEHNSDCFPVLETEVNYDEANERLLSEVEKSINFIKTSI